MKICKICQEEKKQTEFASKGVRISGTQLYRNYCKSCHSEKMRLRRLTNPRLKTKRKESTKSWYFRIKEELNCADCGMSFKGKGYLCDFHHKDSRLKSFNLGGSWKDKKKNILELEISKCDPLCSNCHRIRHHTEKLKCKLNRVPDQL
jgi:hypothetical protein